MQSQASVFVYRCRNVSKYFEADSSFHMRGWESLNVNFRQETEYLLNLCQPIPLSFKFSLHYFLNSMIKSLILIFVKEYRCAQDLNPGLQNGMH